MSQTQNFTFTNPAAWTYNTSEIDISGGAARLNYEDDTGQTFNQDFASDTGFTYDSDKTEFAAGQVQQKSQMPADGISYATYNTDINLNMGGGTLTGTAVGGASITGNRLDLAQSDVRNVTYEDTGLVDFGETGTIKFKYTPDYTNSPVADRALFLIQETSISPNNQISFVHRSSGQMLLYTRDSVGGVEININWHFWQPTAGTTYEIECNFDFTTGASRLFIDGTQQGATLANTYTRTATSQYLAVGADRLGSASDGYFEDFIAFSTVQHTTNYVSGYTLSETAYVEDVITLPDFTYSGLGSIQAFTNIVSTESNTPRYIINGQYYSGGWVASSDTWATASPLADVLTNIATLPAADTVTIKIVTNDTDTQQSVDDLTLTYTGQAYLQTDPSMVSATTFDAEQLFTFVENSTVTGSDAIKYIMIVDTVKYYWSGSAWVESDGTYSQSNSSTDVNTNILALMDRVKTVGIQIFLNSDDGSTTPEITSLVITYGSATINKQINLMSVGEVKDQLGITDTTYDIDIYRFLPLVSADVRKIINDNFTDYTPATITNGSNIMLLDGDYRHGIQLNIGQVIYSDSLPQDTYILSYNPDNGEYTLSETATADAEWVYPKINISQWPTVSKMVYYKITKKSTTAASPEQLTSISYGNVSKTYSADEINRQYDYPEVFINDLGPRYAVTG
jgi:uncharacterized protein involved in tellurium resistance